MSLFTTGGSRKFQYFAAGVKNKTGKACASRTGKFLTGNCKQQWKAGAAVNMNKAVRACPPGP